MTLADRLDVRGQIDSSPLASQPEPSATAGAPTRPLLPERASPGQVFEVRALRPPGIHIQLRPSTAKRGRSDIPDRLCEAVKEAVVEHRSPVAEQGLLVEGERPLPDAQGPEVADRRRRISTSVERTGEKGRPAAQRAKAKFRDHDDHIRPVSEFGKTNECSRARLLKKHR